MRAVRSSLTGGRSWSVFGSTVDPLFCLRTSVVGQGQSWTRSIYQICVRVGEGYFSARKSTLERIGNSGAGRMRLLWRRETSVES